MRVMTAIARELAGFVWGISCVTSDPPDRPSVTTAVSEDGSRPDQRHSLERQELPTSGSQVVFTKCHTIILSTDLAGGHPGYGSQPV
jgi:hypothetical protein